jgi:hypothetical protein
MRVASSQQHHWQEDAMSMFWRPTVMIASVMIMFAAIYLTHSMQSQAAKDGTSTAAIAPDEIMRSIGGLPITVIEDYQ